MASERVRRQATGPKSVSSSMDATGVSLWSVSGSQMRGVAVR